jgi:hypothetical protein
MKNAEHIKSVLISIAKATGLAIAYGFCAYTQNRFGTPYSDVRADRRTFQYLNPTYGGAITVISNSNMASYDRSIAIKSVLKGQTPDYYEAVIAIAASSQTSYDRLVSIRNLKGDVVQ